MTAAERHPLLLMLDDSQWADPDTLAVIEYLADNLAGTRVLCVVALREEPATPAGRLVHRLVERRAVQLLALNRLDADGVAAMVCACRPGADAELIARLQQSADGVPFLVEELLDSPGVPRSLLESVRARLEMLTPAYRRVIELAAVLGIQFDWRRLATAAASSDGEVAAALEEGHRSGLLDVESDGFRFRHALSRDAVLAGLLPPRRAQLARTALGALDAHTGGDPESDDGWRDLAADLAAQAGDADRAARLWLASGRTALARGAVASAIESLQRSAVQARDHETRRAARAATLRALALAGRVDDALTLASDVFDECPLADAVDLYLVLAQACAEAGRWPSAQAQLSRARELMAPPGREDRRQQATFTLLDAEIALGRDETSRARELAELALRQSAGLVPDVDCRAWQLVGRSHRTQDLGRARDGFANALATAQVARLPMSALRALHEMGTIDLFDHGGTDRLYQAARAAEELGALSTAATIQLNLAAAYDQRFDNQRL